MSELTFSRFSNDLDYTDWNENDPVAYMNTFYIMVEDPMYWLQTPYILTYLENDPEDNIPIEDNYRMGLNMQVSWDWSEAD